MQVQHTLPMMKRTSVWMTPVQIAKLNSASKRTGIKVAELIRRYVDEGLKKER
jgi:ribbon-helix-helix protein